MYINPHDQNYTKEDIEKVLLVIKQCVKAGRFIISQNENRQENIDFIQKYNIKLKKQIEIIMSIKVEDFCYSVKNKKKGYEFEILYVFVPQVELFNSSGDLEKIDIYIKFNIVQVSQRKQTIVISFHKRNKAIQYMFRKEIQGVK